MKVVFIGTPDFSVPSLRAIHESKHEVVGIITAPDRKAGRGMKLQVSPVKSFGVANKIPVLQPTNLKNADFQSELRALQADIQVVIAFRMLPEAVWNMPPKGSINLHASLLPDYRGAAPINWAIINGEEVTGLTTFQLVHEIDEGGILMQKEVEILPEDNAGSLYERLMYLGAPLVLETLDGLESGTLIAMAQNPNAQHHQAPKIFKSDCDIDWNQSAKDVHNFIRGMSPYPVARTVIKDEKTGKNVFLKIYSSAYNIEPHSVLPGTFEDINKGQFRIACSDGWLEVLEVQLEGKKRMTSAEYMNGFKR
jgi:methionyl-tRNA formyltransferase